MKKIMVGTVGLFLFAVGPVFPGSSSGFSDSQLQVRTYEGIPYVSGGFGIEERENLRAMSKDDNLELSFALQNKNYLDGAEVLIKNRNGKEVIENDFRRSIVFCETTRRNLHRRGDSHGTNLGAGRPCATQRTSAAPLCLEGIEGNTPDP